MGRQHSKLVAGMLAAAAALSAAPAAHAGGFDDTFGINGTIFTPLTTAR